MIRAELFSGGSGISIAEERVRTILEYVTTRFN